MLWELRTTPGVPAGTGSRVQDGPPRLDGLHYACVQPPGPVGRTQDRDQLPPGPNSARKTANPGPDRQLTPRAKKGGCAAGDDIYQIMLGFPPFLTAVKGLD